MGKLEIIHSIAVKIREELDRIDLVMNTFGLKSQKEEAGFVDVTSTQFHSFDEEIPNVNIGEIPYYLQRNEPDEDQIVAIRW